MIIYRPTESNIEIPEIEGYKKQFSLNLPQGDDEEKDKNPQIVYIKQQEPEEAVVEETPIEEVPVETPKAKTTSKRYNNRNQFISEMTNAYAKALRLHGINPDYAGYLAIQDALESNFGKSYTGNWNYGNITVGSSGASYTEGKDHDGYGRPIINKFRNYNSLDDYINNKIALLSGRRYRAFTGDIRGFYDRVKAGGYAGDPNYVKSLTKLYNQYFPVKGKNGLKIPKFQNSGKVFYDAGKYLVPIAGTYYSIQDAIEDPSFKNISLAGLSAVGDVATIFGVGELAKAGVGAIKAGKTLKVLAPAAKAIDETQNAARIAAINYKNAKQATNAVSLMSDLEQPMSTVSKMARREEAARTAFKEAETASQNAYTNWENLQNLYRSQKYKPNRETIVGATTGYIGSNAAKTGYRKQGGILKFQNSGKIKNFAKKIFNTMSGISQQASENMRDVRTGGFHSTVKELQDEGKYEEAQDLANKYIKASTVGLTLPMMASELTTYGLLGGSARLAAGIGGSKAGEWALGKVGDYADKQLGTTWIGPTGRVIGGLAGWGLGTKPVQFGLRSAAANGVTMHMPTETFNTLRHEAFTNSANKVGQRYFGKNLNRNWIQTLKDNHAFDRFIRENLEWRGRQAFFNDEVERLVHWDPMATGTKSGAGIAKIGDPKDFVHIENGKFVAPKTQITSKSGENLITHSAEEHPIFWDANRPWFEVPGSSNVYLLNERTKIPEWRNKKRALKESNNSKTYYIKNNKTNDNHRYLVVDPKKSKIDFILNTQIGSQTRDVPIDEVTGFEYNPLTKTFSKVKYSNGPKGQTPEEIATTFDARSYIPSEVKPIIIEKGERSIYSTPKTSIKSFTLEKPILSDLGAMNASTKSQSITISPDDLSKFLGSQKDFRFLGHGTGRNNPEIQSFFENGLRTRTGDITDTTIPLENAVLKKWPHLDSDNIVILPSKISAGKYDSRFGHIPTDFFDASTFHWTDNPKTIGKGLLAITEPNASFTRSEKVAGIPGVYTKPEAIWGVYNTKTNALTVNPNSQYKFSIFDNGTTSAKTSININKNNFASDIYLNDKNPINIDDAATFAYAVTHPGELSSSAQLGIEKSKQIFTSPWMKTRLKNMGYSDSEIQSYINSRLKGLDTSKISVADDLNNVVEFTPFSNGTIRIDGYDPILIGQNSNAIGIKPFDQQIIQVTKRGDPIDTILHEVGGHGTEDFNFAVDRFGEPIYANTKLTQEGRNIAISTGLGENYYLSPKEQRARWLTTAQKMSEEGFDPNSYSDFNKFLNIHKNDPLTTNVGQTARLYDRSSIWPSFSKARSLIPLTILGGTTAIQQNKKPNSK